MHVFIFQFASLRIDLAVEEINMADIVWWDLENLTAYGRLNLDITYPFVPSKLHSVYYTYTVTQGLKPAVWDLS